MSTGNADDGDSDTERNNSSSVSAVPFYPPFLSYWDKGLICRFANTATLDWFQLTESELIGLKHIRDCIGPEQFSKDKLHIESALNGKFREFERVLSNANTSGYHALISFIPDIHKGQTLGFFVCVCDSRYTWRKSDYKLVDEKKLLRAVIEIQEKERAVIADLLRDNVNQLLVYVNLMLQGKLPAKENPVFTGDIVHTIQTAIEELNKMSNSLYPSGITLLGLLPSLDNLVSQYNDEKITDISFYCNSDEIEELNVQDKLSVYRIIQDYISLVVKKRKSRYIQVELNYRAYCLMIRIVYNGSGERPDRNSDEFRDIRSRIDFYSGKISEFHGPDEQVFITHMVFNHD